MSTCSFHTITGSSCGSHPRFPKDDNTVVQLTMCDRDITSHLEDIKVVPSITSEAALILARIGIFEIQRPENFTICPLHRGNLGIHWKSRQRRCSVPNEIASHPKKIAPVGERGVGYFQSKKIMDAVQILVPVGSGM